MPGGNYGWPVVEGVTDDPGFRDPIVTWTPAEASPSGVVIVGRTLYGAALRDVGGDLGCGGGDEGGAVWGAGRRRGPFQVGVSTSSRGKAQPSVLCWSPWLGCAGGIGAGAAQSWVVGSPRAGWT
ncbi:hypothetical protein [Micromonospora sp. NPDC048063]|uniref:hypothetical protein n=1 Tax=Micromonospora sp. NPDC048063 TaxID=3364256 RepID=UPI003716FE45